MDFSETNPKENFSTPLPHTRLSVNVNKIATLRNSRGANNPNLIEVVKDCERFGAEGITVHPRPDERHIRYADVLELKEIVKTEFNIEGRPDPQFMDLVLRVKPDQCTLVPDAPHALTSNQGWDTIRDFDLLRDIVQELKRNGIRVSIFMDPDSKKIEKAALTGAERIELYTESYAKAYASEGSKDLNSPQPCILPFIEAAKTAHEQGLGINAGHDLDLKNLAYFKKHIPGLLEVSIGHALICDSLYLGLENTIQLYRRQLQ
jgi:pyridoxine 5-phosphate synthase